MDTKVRIYPSDLDVADKDDSFLTDKDSESISLVVNRKYTPANPERSFARTKPAEARDYDSLNNFVLLESDNESILNDGKIDISQSDRDSVDTISLSTKLPKANQCCCPDTTSVGSTSSSKLMFREELNKHRSLITRGIREGTRDTDNNYRLNSRRSIWRSFVSLCIGLLFAFMSFMPLRNIQTSLYPRNHLGNVSLACMYFSFAVGCLVSSWIVQNARPKGIILVALFGHVVYCGANIYPSMYTLIPSACFFGFFHAPMWSAQELMIASYGASYTAITSIHIDKAINQFQGVFLVFCHAAQIFGNIIESAILHCGDYDNEAANRTKKVASYEYSLYNGPIKIDNITEEVSGELVWIGPFGYRIQPEMSLPGDKTNYENIVKFVFISFAVIGMTIICLFLNKPDIIIHKKKTALSDRLREVALFLPTGTFLSLFLLMLFSGMQQAVVIGIVTKLFGSLTMGMSMVGYMMMCYGTCQLAALLLMERLHTRLKPSVAVFNAFLITLGLLVWLYIWVPTPENTFKVLGYIGLWGAVDGLWQSQVQTFLITLGLLVWLYIWVPTPENTFKVLGYIGLWGAVDGLWQSQVQTILLSWSVGRKEAAVTVFRTVQSLGLVLVFVLDIWLTLLTLICICGAILVFGVIFYLILEVIRTPLTSSDPPPFSL